MSALIEKKIIDLKAEGKRILARMDELANFEKLDKAHEDEYNELQTRQSEVLTELQKWKETGDKNAALKAMFGPEQKQETPGFGGKSEGSPIRKMVLDMLEQVKDPSKRGLRAGASISDFPAYSEKALITADSATSGGAFITNQRLPGYDDGGLLRDFTLLDILPRMAVGETVVELPVLSSFTNSAAEVLESTNGTDGEKPESALVMAVKEFKLHTVAHHLPITRKTFRDAKQMVSLAELFLRYGCFEQWEDQVIQGANTPDDNIVGMFNTTGIQTQSYSTNLLDTARKALTKGKKYSKPNAWFMAPETWETIELTKDGESRYFYSGPQGVGPAILWGRPVFETAACPTTHFGLIDSRHNMLLDLEQFMLHVTDSHADEFIFNILRYLGEMTVGFASTRPKSIVKAATS